MPSSHQRFLGHQKSRNQKRTPIDVVLCRLTLQYRPNQKLRRSIWLQQHQCFRSLTCDQRSQMDNQVVNMLKNAFLYPCAKTKLKHIFLTCASTGGSACRWRRGIQSTAQPAQVSWDCHSGCLGLTGLTSTTWRSRHNPGPWATTD